MSLGTILYTLLIEPLKLLFETVYTFAYYISSSAGLSIVILSLAMNVLLMPLYSKADALQKEEDEIQKKLKAGVDHIRKTFKGDEQLFILNTYYRQNHYKPIYALRSSISLLLEIPFFIAAYDFLSNEYTVLASSFGPIVSLGNPDGLLGGINLLPILMTVINIVSSLIYTKGQPLRKNIQLYAMAIIFLVVLYDRPSGLVLYWTLNNIFSLIKNILTNLKDAKRIVSILLSLSGLIGLFAVLSVHPMRTIPMQIAVIIVTLMFQMPLLLYLCEKKNIRLLPSVNGDNSLIIPELIFLSIYYGLFIPCRVIGSSPSEFVDLSSLINPTVYILATFLLATGIFAIWTAVYCSLMNDGVRMLMQFLLAVFSVVSVADFLFFGTELGTMSNLLIYHGGMQYAMNEVLENVVIILLLCSIIFIVFRKKKDLLKAFLIITTIAMTSLSSIRLYKINEEAKTSIEASNRSKSEIAEIELSRNGKNVVIIVLDRAINTYFPYIMNEIPGLRESYSGFTYYPNTVSFGAHTNLAAPAVYGGYEYTPEELDRRLDENLMDKHNESLKVLPVLFDENGFEVTVFDPCYANYSYPADLSIYADYPDIKAYNTDYGMFEIDRSIAKNDLAVLKRNLFCYGLTKSVPLLLQPILYNGGAYNSIELYNSIYSDESKSMMSFQGMVDESFLRCYAVLENMIGITKIQNEDSNHFLFMYNNTTHEPVLLQEPDYEVKKDVDNYDFDMENQYSRTDGMGNTITFESYAQISHYHANVAAYRELGKWLDYLKKNGVYDNTRIIIVADHGKDLNQYEDMIYTYSDGETVDLMKYNPVLIVKDFDSDSFEINDSFMTNADVASLAVDNLIDKPVNPFTGNLISDQKKYENSQHIFMSDNYMVHVNNGKKYIPGRWMYVSDNIFDIDNWTEDLDQ